MLKRKSLVSLIVLGASFGIISAKSYGGRPVNVPIRAAIIPHHLVASEFMSDLGQRLVQNQNLTKVVIIGPNHYEVGNRHLITDSPEFTLAEYAPRLVANDHVCYAPRGILLNHLSATKFSCILISYKTTPDEIRLLSKSLSQYLGSTGVLVASVDFSHYQTLDVASQNDLTTQSYLDLVKAGPLQKLGNDYLDSPRTIDVLFHYLSLNSIQKKELVNHSNSALILGDTSLPSTTSYFEYIYY